MIIIQLKGGLGNQMFQYAMGRRVAHANNTDLKLDISWFNNIGVNYTPRKYSLQPFNIIENFASINEIKALKRGRIHNLTKRILTKERFSNNVYLSGYWQNEKYFKDIEDIIRKEFTLKKPIRNKYIDLINHTNSVSLHIRRGDYVINPEYRKTLGACPLSYYHKAIRNILNFVTHPHFFIFSDDIKWAKNNLKFKHPVTFVSNKEQYLLKNTNTDYEDLILMSKCKHNIIANSSFSWWGAWLNSNPDKIVIAPKKWFNDLSLTNKDLIPELWMKI